MDLGKIAGNIATGLFVLLFIVAAVIILAPFAGWHIDTVLSGSMEPAIPTGSMVITGPVAASDIRVGDVIAFSPPLVITEPEIDALLERTERALADTLAWVRSWR
jgi:signal peptidase